MRASCAFSASADFGFGSAARAAAATARIRTGARKRTNRDNDFIGSPSAVCGPPSAVRRSLRLHLSQAPEVVRERRHPALRLRPVEVLVGRVVAVLGKREAEEV